MNTLKPSEIEWDTVDPSNPATWTNWEKELLDSNLSQVEVNRVLGLCLEANALDDSKLQKAREVFLRGPEPMPNMYSGPQNAQ